MDRNVGGRDRTARIVLGAGLFVGSMVLLTLGTGLAADTRLLVSTAALLAGSVLLATAGAETCPANAALGRDTYREVGTEAE